MKVRRVGVRDLEGLAVRLRHRADRSSTEPTHQTSADIASTLPEELVEEILLRVGPDEPAHLVRASLVCKAWHSILSDEYFRRRYRRFHGTPRLLGYFCSHRRDSTVRFIPMTSGAASSPVCVLKLDNSRGRKHKALDCHHGRVLIEADDNRRLIVWDTIAGSQHHLSLLTCLQFPCWYNHAGSVLCAKDGCDHLDCHRGPFIVVLVGTSFDYGYGVQTWSSVYSSETGVWSSRTIRNDKEYQSIDDTKPGLLIGDAIYYTTICGHDIVKYDLRKHELTVMHLPVAHSIPIKASDGGLGVATMLGNCIYMWLWQVDNKGVGGWFQHSVLELEDTLFAQGDLICMVEGTNTIFIAVEHTGIFTLDLRSRHVRKIGEKETSYYRSIVPYMSFSIPKY